MKILLGVIELSWLGIQPRTEDRSGSVKSNLEGGGQ